MDIDEKFYERADAHINLSNDQLKETGLIKVNDSMMYAMVRFNAWVSANGFDSAQEMTSARDEIIEYFVIQYRSMLEENVDNYIANFDQFMGMSKENA
jgi:hypothetical protein